MKTYQIRIGYKDQVNTIDTKYSYSLRGAKIIRNKAIRAGYDASCIYILQANGVDYDSFSDI